jgi:DNA-binding SARP family transcriptional activator
VTGSVHIRLLGPPAILRDGARAPIDTRKAIALLAYLVRSGRPISRDHLAALLWPDADQTRARSALRRTLSSLNAALGSGLAIERESLRFTGAGVSTDVDEFVAAARSDDPADWDRAVDLYAGDLLAGFTLRDSAEFEEWQLAAADELRRDLAGVLERLVFASLPDDPDAAIAHAKRWIELDPLHEPAHRAAMRAYIAKDDRSSALRQYRECVAVLERELGVEPLDETTELYESIRERRPAASAPSSTPRRTESIDLPIVGRDDEIGLLRSVYDEVSVDGRLIVIDGEPGIGKTRLANEFLDGVRERGGATIATRCHPEEQTMAFGAIADLVGRSFDRDDGRSVEFAAARRRVITSFVDALTDAVSGTQPGAILVDDLQWIDESSLDVLRFLARRLAGRPLVLLVTWRTEEVPPADPRRRMLADAHRDGLSSAITLERLSRAEVSELAAMTPGGSAHASTLYEETAGVPFFVVEYLRAGMGAGLPTGVRDLLASRIDGSSATALQVLTATAVLGRGADPEMVKATSGRTDTEIAAALEELVASGLIAETGDTYEFTHPKLREYVYDRTTLGRRRLLHAPAGKAIMRRVRRRPELAAIAAQHLERGGDGATAATLYELAATDALARYANAESLAHLRSALALGHPDDAALHERVADLLTLEGAYREAIASYEKAAALGADISSIGTKLGNVHHRLGDFDAAEAYYLEATDAVAGGPGAARLLAERALNAHRADRPSEAGDLAARALAVASEQGDTAALAHAHNIFGVVASRAGDGGLAREHLHASLKLAERSGDHAAIAAVLNNLAIALRADGRTDEALAQAERALELCRQIGDRHREAAVLSNIADALRDAGRTDEAVEHIRMSAMILADVGEPGEGLPEVWKLTEW